MKITFKLMLFGIVYVTSNVATANVNISPLQPQAKGENFPLVIVAKRSVISKKINTHLQLEHLRHLPHVFKKNPFEKVRFDEKNCCSNITFDAWQQHKTPYNILSIGLTGDATGAYTEMFDVYENFDTRSGDPVTLNALIKSNKTQSLRDVLVSKVRQRITSYISEIKKDARTDSIMHDDVYAEQQDLYSECLHDLKDATLDWFNFYVKDKSVVFVKGRCSNHAMRAVDDIGTFRIELPIHSLQPYLTPYGKNVLSDSTQLVTNKSLEGKLLKGTLGKTKVHFLLKETHEDASIDAVYWYNKYQQPIELGGMFKNNKLNAYESYYDETKQTWIKRGIIQATWKGGKLKGTWRNAKTNRVYRLYLTEYNP